MAVGGAVSRRAAWWLLLTCTVVGLAAMHTLGHGRHAGSSHAPVSPVPALSPVPVFSPVSAVSALSPVSVVSVFSHGSAGAVFSVLSPVSAGPWASPALSHVSADLWASPSLPHVSSAHVSALRLFVIDFLSGDGEPDGGHGVAWRVCLAVLVGLTVAVLLLAWLLRWRAGGLGTMRVSSAGRVISRAPPRRGVGLRLASVSVMRI